MNCSLPDSSSGVQKPHGSVSYVIFHFDTNQIYSTAADKQSESALMIDPFALYNVKPEKYIEWIIGNIIQFSGRSVAWRAGGDNGLIDISHMLRSTSNGDYSDVARHLVFIDKHGFIVWYESCDMKKVAGKRQYCKLMMVRPGDQYATSIMYTMDKSTEGYVYVEKITGQFGKYCSPGDN